MSKLDTRLYLRFTLDTREEDVRRRFVERYGTDPERVERVVTRESKGKVFGWWEAGPAPGTKNGRSGHDA